MSNRHILLVDDTKVLASLYATALELDGFQVTTAHSGAEVLRILETDAFAPDLLILDVKLPDTNGLELLAQLKNIGFDAPVIVITGHGSIHMAVDAMRLGATDFLVKPFPIDKLLESTHRTVEAAGLLTKAVLGATEDALYDGPGDDAADKKAAPPRRGFGSFVGMSPPMQLVFDVIESAAKSNATVFVTGESGTGKEVCAEAIHRLSRRAGAPFVAINCAAIPRELLESELFGHVKGAFTGATSNHDGAVAQACGGTLFLDEIAEMAPEMQTKLLRFLQNLSFRKIGSGREEKANVRIICATNRDPLQEIKSGALRQDLYYRLHVIPIHMPPLRARMADIIDLADHFLRLYAREEGKSFRSFARDAEQILLSYQWPGNVRQLQNIVRGIVVLHEGKFITAPMLPALLKEQGCGSLSVENPALSAPTAQTGADSAGEVCPLWKVERSAIEQAIARCEGNIPKAAALLEISPSTIYRKKMLWDKRLPGGELQYSSSFY